MGIAGLVLSIFSLVLTFLSWIPGVGTVFAIITLPISIAGLIISSSAAKMSGNRDSGLAICGTVFGILAIFFAAFSFIFCGICAGCGICTIGCLGSMAAM